MKVADAVSAQSSAKGRRRGHEPLSRHSSTSDAGRAVFDWLPNFHLSAEDVFRVIHDTGQLPYWNYDHLSRCSQAPPLLQLAKPSCSVGSKGDVWP